MKMLIFARKIITAYPIVILGVILLLILFFSYLLSYFIVLYNTWVSNLFFFVLFVLCLDYLFRKSYKFAFGVDYNAAEKIRFENLHVKPHPYLRWVYKTNFTIQKKATIAKYPLNYGNFSFPRLTTNDFGVCNGVDGTINYNKIKSPSVIRVICIGASTTGNYISDDTGVYSYPLELERLLLKKYPGRQIEVINFGQGGYNSTDILIRLAIQVIDYSPDIVVLYHGYNDIRNYLTDGFKSDYSHACKNISSDLWRFKIGCLIPKLHISLFDFLISLSFPNNVRNSLLNLVSVGNIDLDLDPSTGLATFKRNISSIVDISNGIGAQTILCTYAHYLHDGISNQKNHIKYSEIVQMENKKIQEIAGEKGSTLVDIDSLMPRSPNYFVDSVHFTPLGMHTIAEHVANNIKI